MTEARRAPRGGVATPHYLASSAGLAALAEGGNAVDAIVAANLALGVVAPYFCGYGGDLFAIVWDGRAPRLSGLGTLTRLGRRRRDPRRARHDAAARPARRHRAGGARGLVRPARPVGDRVVRRARRAARCATHATGSRSRPWAGAYFRGCVQIYDGLPRVDQLRTATSTPASSLRQPALARHDRSAGRRTAPTPTTAARSRPRSRSRCRPVAAPSVRPTSPTTPAGSRAPLRATYRDVESRRTSAAHAGRRLPLEALRILDGLDLPADGPARWHLLIEALKLALADRDDHVTDPDAMPRAGRVGARGCPGRRPGCPDRSRARRAAANCAGVQPGALLTCARRTPTGCMVSLIQSNFLAFGSGVHVPEWGINLNNRGSSFSPRPSPRERARPRQAADAHADPGDGPARRPTLARVRERGSGHPGVRCTSSCSCACCDDGPIPRPRSTRPGGASTAAERVRARRRGGRRGDHRRICASAVTRSAKVSTQNSGMGHAHAIQRDATGLSRRHRPARRGCRARLVAHVNARTGNYHHC